MECLGFTFSAAWLRRKDQKHGLDVKTFEKISSTAAGSKEKFLLDRFLEDQTQFVPKSSSAGLRSDLRRLPRAGQPPKSQTVSSMSCCSMTSLAPTTEVVDDRNGLCMAHKCDTMLKLLETRDSSACSHICKITANPGIRIEAVYI